MVTQRPLKLRAQVGATGKKVVARVLPIARVWVDTGVFHLDTPYDYWVPEEFSESIEVGTRVQVEFGSTLHEAIVVERIESSPNSGKLKQVIKVLSPNTVATAETLEIFRLVARRWAGSPFDVARGAIPARVAGVDKEDYGKHHVAKLLSDPVGPIPRTLAQPKARHYWTLPPAHNRLSLVADLVATRSRFGQVLVVAPDERELEGIEEELLKFFVPENIARVDGHLSRSDRYRNFIRVQKGLVQIVIGLRGSVFAPLGGDATIIVVNESSASFHELRTPGWNARDIALLRANEHGRNVIFLGYSPSMEIARLIETGWLNFIPSKTRLNVVAQAQEMGELLPSKVFPLVRNALKSGPVLFLVPRKGYGNSVLCRKCRNAARCHCGGRLELTAAGQVPRCVMCHTMYNDWHCGWCQSTEIYLAARGIDRFVEEIGRAFPNLPIVNSSGEHIVDSVAPNASLVVATPGSQPKAIGGYSSVILLEGQRFFGHSELRSTESTREWFFESSAMAKPDASVFISILPSHPIIAALTRWDPLPAVRVELHERGEMNFPPYYRFISVEVESHEAMPFRSGLINAQRDLRIPSTTKVSAPREKTKELSVITLSAPVVEAQKLIDFVHELQRRRSIARKTLLSIRVDPYSLT